MDEALHGLVEKTRGLQPWRRVFHACSGTALVGFLLLYPMSEGLLLLFLGVVLILQVALDLIRLTRPAVNLWFFRWFSALASPREAGGIASSTWYTLGMLLCFALFPRSVALAAVLVLSLADPAASYLGRRWGKRRLGKGTVEGSAVFGLLAFGLLCLFAPWPAALGAALFATLAEGFPWPLDDNLTIPLAAAGGLLLLL